MHRINSYMTTVRKLSAEEKVAQACEARRRYSNDIATYEEVRLAKQKAEEAKQKAQKAEREAQEDRLKMEEMAREIELLRGNKIVV